MTHILPEHAAIESVYIDDDVLAAISLILETRCNFSIMSYKDTYIKRRIAIRMRSCRCLGAADYCNMLRQNDLELDLLKKTLTINVSQFFRNPSMFMKLQTAVLPKLFQDADVAQKPLIFQSIGCASGEEAYSLGIILRDFFARELQRIPVEIYASDVDTDILLSAKLGEYNTDHLKNVSDSARERYFTPSGSRMQLSAHIRDMVTFHQQNIMDVSMLKPCQMVLCRNILIYFGRLEQEKILCGIAQILTSGGILALGKSERLVGEARELFTTVCPVEKIYRRR